MIHILHVSQVSSGMACAGLCMRKKKHLPRGIGNKEHVRWSWPLHLFTHLLYMCIGMYTLQIMCKDMYACMCVSIWRSDVNLWWCSSAAIHLAFGYRVSD